MCTLNQNKKNKSWWPLVAGHLFFFGFTMNLGAEPTSALNRISAGQILHFEELNIELQGSEFLSVAQVKCMLFSDLECVQFANLFRDQQAAMRGFSEQKAGPQLSEVALALQAAVFSKSSVDEFFFFRTSRSGSDFEVLPNSMILDNATREKGHLRFGALIKSQQLRKVAREGLVIGFDLIITSRDSQSGVFKLDLIGPFRSQITFSFPVNCGLRRLISNWDGRLLENRFRCYLGSNKNTAMFVFK